MGQNNFDRRNRSPRGNGNNNSSDKPYTKRSGATHGVAGPKNKPYIRGWNYSKRFGLVTYYCTPYEKTKEVKSKKGIRWANYVCIVQRKNMEDVLTNCLVNVDEKKAILPAYGMVINPKKDYCGTFSGGK